MKEIGWQVIFIILLFFSCTPASKQDSYSVEEDIPDPALRLEEPKTHIVEIRQMKFEPAEVKVHKGDRVLWINKGITNRCNRAIEEGLGVVPAVHRSILEYDCD